MSELVPSPTVIRRTDDVIALEGCLRGAAKILRDLIVREATDPQRPPAPQNDLALDVLAKLVGGIKTGTDLKTIYPAMTQLIANQQERVDLIDNLLLTHDYDRLVLYTKARWRLEQFLLGCAERGDLTPAEAMALQSIVVTETNNLYGRVRGGTASVKDVVLMMSKVDTAVQANEQKIHAELSRGTTPHGREIIRRLMSKLERLVDKDE